VSKLQTDGDLFLRAQPANGPAQPDWCDSGTAVAGMSGLPRCFRSLAAPSPWTVLEDFHHQTAHRTAKWASDNMRRAPLVMLCAPRCHDSELQGGPSSSWTQERAAAGIGELIRQSAARCPSTSYNVGHAMMARWPRCVVTREDGKSDRAACRYGQRRRESESSIPHHRRLL